MGVQDREWYWQRGKDVRYDPKQLRRRRDVDLPPAPAPRRTSTFRIVLFWLLLVVLITSLARWFDHRPAAPHAIGSTSKR